MATATHPAPVRSAGLKEWLGLGVLALPTLLLSLDITVLHLGVPHISEDLRPTSSQLLWIIDVYGFMIAGLLVTMGTVGDRIGRRRLLLIGAAAFGAASAAAAFSGTAEMLIVSRALMGVAGATLMPSTLALISNMFRDPQQRGLAIGIWATMFSAGIALGPILGGVLLEHFWWGSVFLLGVPVMLLLLVTAPFLLPEFRDAAAGRPDLVSVALVITAMLAVTFGIKELASHGLTLLPVASLLLGVVLGVLFVRRQRRLTDPLLDLRLFSNRALRVGLLALSMSTATVGGIYLFITQYLQLIVGRSPLAAGALLLPAAGALIVASLLAPIIARRVRPGVVITAALVMSAVGYVVLSQVRTAADLPMVVVGFVLVYAGVGPVTALGTELVVGTAPPERAGAASALSETSTELGVALGVAVLGSVGAAVYRLGVTTGAPTGIDDGGLRDAHETLAGALQVSEGLPTEIGDALVTVATAAFTDGFSGAAWASAGLIAVVAVVAAAGLRRVSPSREVSTPDATQRVG